MIRGLYTAAAGMLTQQHRNDILTNNLTNINTPGFQAKQDMMRSFPEVFIHAMRLENGSSKRIGSISQGVFIEESVPIFVQGAMMDTDIPSHMAILDQDLSGEPGTDKQPKLFFTLADANGQRYLTRSGLFTEDAAGQLVTPEGYLVLDDSNNPIQIRGREFAMDDKGNLTFVDGEVIRVGLTKINNTDQLINYGNQMYTYSGNVDELEYVGTEENYQLFSGRLESSNVDPTQTMVDMMTALRLYEANQKVIQSLDSTLQKAVNEIGRI